MMDAWPRLSPPTFLTMELHVPNIDYMKVIGVMSKTLQLETIDLQFPDKSIDRLEITMGGQAQPEKKFRLNLSAFSFELVFSLQYLGGKLFDKWLTSFEYELEQAFMKNVEVHDHKDLSNHVIKVTL
jgi:hypothetical protein